MTAHTGGAGATDSSCALSPFAGSWRSTDAKSDMLVRLDITEKCERMATNLETEHNARPGANPWANMIKPQKSYIYREFTLRPFDRCYPANCVWARQKGHRDGEGVLKATFKLFWSTRHLEITPSNGGLNVSWKIEYVGRKKPDEFGETLMVRDD